MKTALLLANSAEAQQQFASLLGHEVNLILLTPPAEPAREKFEALIAPWRRLADSIVLDAVSLGESTRWALEVVTAGSQAVVVRATEFQCNVHQFPSDWLVLTDTDPLEQTERALRTFFQLRAAQAQLKRADTLLTRQRQASPAVLPATSATVVGADTLRYRDALKNIALIVGRHLDENVLLVEFLRIVRELLGVGKLAMFSRRYQSDLFTGHLALEGRPLSIVGSSGVAPNVVEHLRLSLDAGIGGYLAREARILRRTQLADPLALDHDPQVAREFELLGTEIAMPMFDEDQLLGVLTFSGKITGDPLSNEELELVYHLMSQLAQAIRNMHLQAKISGQQRFMSEVLSNVQSGVVVVGQDDRILSINRPAHALLGLDNGEVVGQGLNRLPACVADALFEVLQTGQPIVEREMALPKNRRPLRLNAARFEADLGRDRPPAAGNLMVVALIEDLTQAKIQQAHARELADKEFFARLASRLSHELKNALVSIKIFGQLLPERYGEQEFRDEFSKVVVNEVNRVDSLVGNLTFFSHPLGLVHEELRIEELLDASMRGVAQEFNRKRLLQVAVQGDPAPTNGNGGDLPMVTLKKLCGHKVTKFAGDKIRLIQAFDHILRNALQALSAGGRVSISTGDAQPSDFPAGQFPEGGALKIEWLDSGEGIELVNLPRVTEPFMTTRNVGVGLGLTIVKKIVERHSGRLLVDSLFGKGTTVTVLLPVKPQPHPEDELLKRIAELDHQQGNNDRDGAALAVAGKEKKHGKS